MNKFKVGDKARLSEGLAEVDTGITQYALNKMYNDVFTIGRITTDKRNNTFCYTNDVL